MPLGFKSPVPRQWSADDTQQIGVRVFKEKGTVVIGRASLRGKEHTKQMKSTKQKSTKRTLLK